MPLRTSIDDTNTTLIDYSGDWIVLTDGSTRQWERSIHSTDQANASATFRFRGYQIWVWGSIPAGTATNAISISLDGATPQVTSRTSNGSTVYNELYYTSGLIDETYHSIIVTNTGTGTGEFMLDRFEFEGNDAIPLFAPPGSSTTTSTPTPTSTISTSPTASRSSGSKAPIGAILGAIIGVLALLIAALVFILWRRQRHSRNGSDENKKPSIFSRFKSTSPNPTPFTISDRPPVSGAPFSTTAQNQVSNDIGGLLPITSHTVTTTEKGPHQLHQTGHVLSSPPSSSALTSAGNVPGITDFHTDPSSPPLTHETFSVVHDEERPPPYPYTNTPPA